LPGSARWHEPSADSVDGGGTGSAGASAALAVLRRIVENAGQDPDEAEERVRDGEGLGFDDTGTYSRS
jgi:hypothetical protein